MYLVPYASATLNPCTVHVLYISQLACTLSEEIPALICVPSKTEAEKLEFRVVRPDGKALVHGPFRASEIGSKLIEGPKNRSEAYCGAFIELHFILYTTQK